MGVGQVLARGTVRHYADEPWYLDSATPTVNKCQRGERRIGRGVAEHFAIDEARRSATRPR